MFSIQHMSMELLLIMSGQKMLHVPYKATHPALMDVVAGHIPLMIIATTSALPQVRAGRVRTYGVLSATPEAFGAYIRPELLKWAKVVRDSGITAQ